MIPVLGNKKSLNVKTGNKLEKINYFFFDMFIEKNTAQNRT